MVEPPYREAHKRIADPIFKPVDSSFEVILHEAQLCLALLEMVKADVVHLDTSLGGVALEDLSPVDLANMNLSSKARVNLLQLLPKLRKVAGEIKRRHGIEMLAMGKESVAVRVAELTAGAEAVVYACADVAKSGEPLLVGLPTRCEHSVVDGSVYLQSLIDVEHDVRGYAQDTENGLAKVELVEMLNPVARGFRAIKIKPKP